MTQQSGVLRHKDDGSTLSYFDESSNSIKCSVCSKVLATFSLTLDGEFV